MPDNGPEVTIPPLEIDQITHQPEGIEDVEVGQALFNLRTFFSRYARTVQVDPRSAAERGILPSWSAIAVVRSAREGDWRARNKIKTVFKLADSEYPDAPLARKAVGNLFKAAALEDAGVKLTPDVYTHEEAFAQMDRESEAMEDAGEEVGLGFLPWIGGAVAALLLYLGLKPSVAKALSPPAKPGEAPSKPGEPTTKAPIEFVRSTPSEPGYMQFAPGVGTGASPGWLKLSSIVGRKIGEIPENVRGALEEASARVFNFVDPRTGANVSADQLKDAQLAIPVPQWSRDQYGQVYVRRPAKERLADADAIRQGWHHVDEMVVMAPVIVQQEYGPFGITMPDWAKAVVKTAASAGAASVGVPIPPQAIPL